MKKVIITVIVTLIAVFAVRYYVISNRETETTSQDNTVTVNSVIKESLADIGELYTIEYDYTMQSTTTDPVELLGIKLPFGQNKLSYLYSGAMKVGVDLNRADISVTDKTITVTFPELIAQNTYDENSIEFYDVKQYSFNKKALEKYQTSRITNLNAVKTKAEKAGIYDKAKENLTSMLQNQFIAILRQTGSGENYTVNVVVESDDVNFQYDEQDE